MVIDKSIAIFLWGKGELSAYGKLLRKWTRNQPETQLFTDANQFENESLHYLQFSHINQQNPFDLILHDVDDSAAHAVGFYYLQQFPGVQFISNHILKNYSASISHEAKDPFGTGWLLESRLGVKARNIARLIDNDIDVDDIFERYSVAHSLASFSRGVVIPVLSWFIGQEAQTCFCSHDLDHSGFAEFMNEMLPIWQKNKAIGKSLDHPYVDPIAVEEARIDELYSRQEATKLKQLLKELAK